MTTDFQEFLPMLKEQLQDGGSVSFTPLGDSMLPLMRSGRDKVILSAGKPRKQDVILFQRNDGTLVLHRIIKVEEKDFILRGDHQFWTEKVPKEAAIGVVTGYTRGGRFYKRKGAYDRLYLLALPLIRLQARILEKWRRLF